MRKNAWLAQNKDDHLHDCGSDDQLSRLPDDILVSILSYLSLKNAAVTSKLSRRWRYLWCQMARLDFEDKKRSTKLEIGLRRSCFAGSNSYNNLCFVEGNEYINWVNRIIRQHISPTIDEFRVCFNLDKKAKGAIGKWIEFAISKNVQTLELNFRDGFNYSNRGNYVFPDKIFDGKYESSLNRTSISAPVRPCANSMEIKFLKTLILKRVDVDDEGLKKILSNCPVLEHLLIDQSSKLVKAKIHGKGLALKNLEIKLCDELKSIEICDSNIVSFNFRGSSSKKSAVNLRPDNLQKLEKISIHDYRFMINQMVFQISCSIPNLQVLELIVLHPQEDMQFLLFPDLPKLKQLTMEVGIWDDGSLSLLTSMVEACPNLQRLTIKLTWLSARSINRQVGKPPYQHLEVVEIRNYHGWPCDVDMVMYFIENSVALKKLVIKPYLSAEHAGQAANKITKERIVARYRVLEQLRPNTPIGVELVVL